MAEPIPLSGGIDPRSFPFLLADLYRQRATGSLRVEGPSYQKALYFRSGRVLFGSSNDPRDQLGAILIESGRLTAEQLEEVNSRVGPGNPLAKLLAESGIVSQRELGEAARSKVERIVSDLLTYDQGSYEFEDGVLPKGAVDLKLSTERLMLAASRRVEERAFVLRHVDSLQTVLAPLAGGEAAAEELRHEIGEVLDQFDGQRTLKDVATAAGTDDFDTARIACALLFLRVLQPAEDAATIISSGSPFVEAGDEGDFASGGAEIDLAAEAVGALGGGGAPGPLLDAEPEPGLPDVFDPGPESDDADATVAIPTPEFSPDEASEPDFGADEPEIGLQPQAEPEATPAWQPEPEPEPRPEPAWQPEPEPDPEPQATWAPEPEPEPDPAWQAQPEPEPEPEPEAAWVPEPEPAAEPERAWQPSASFDVPASPQTIGETRPPSVRPSREDLAALDALLNNRALEEGPLEPLEKNDDSDWRPQFLPGGSTQPPRGRAAAATSGSKLLPAIAGVLVLLAAAGGGIYALGGVGPAIEGIKGLAGRGEPQVAEVPPAPEPVPQQPLATPETGDGAIPPDGTPTGAEPQADATPEGPDATPTPEPVATPEPPLSTPPPPTPAPTPAPATPAPVATSTGTTPPSVDAARAALRGGRFADAARGFAAQLRGAAPFTLQILVACSVETLDKANRAVDAPEMYVLPVSLEGRECYRVCWGLYASEAEAGQASGQVHRYFIQNGARPRVVRSETLF